MRIQDLYDLDHTLANDYLSQYEYTWEALKGIKDFIGITARMGIKQKSSLVKIH